MVAEGFLAHSPLLLPLISLSLLTTVLFLGVSSAHGSPGNSPYRHSVASPLSTHSNGGSTSHGSDASNGCMVTNGSGFTSPDLNGASHSLEDLEDDEHMGTVDTHVALSSVFESHFSILLILGL